MCGVDAKVWALWTEESSGLGSGLVLGFRGYVPFTGGPSLERQGRQGVWKGDSGEGKGVPRALANYSAFPLSSS